MNLRSSVISLVWRLQGSAYAHHENSRVRVQPWVLVASFEDFEDLNHDAAITQDGAEADLTDIIDPRETLCDEQALTTVWTDKNCVFFPANDMPQKEAAFLGSSAGGWIELACVPSLKSFEQLCVCQPCIPEQRRTVPQWVARIGRSAI